MATARQSAIPLIAAVFLVLSSMILSPPAQAELFSPAMLATFKAGTVDAVHDSSIRISGMEYRVKPDAQILDHKGHETSLARIFIESEARFHLSKSGDIDMMVVTRPQ
jgi:hypothetical protein